MTTHTPAVGRRIVTLALWLLATVPGAARATRYPPGPKHGDCTDSLRIAAVQNPDEPCHPAAGDSVYGVGGIVTAVDHVTPGYGFYFQNHAVGANGAPWTGVFVTTDGVDLASALGLVRGDSVVVYGRVQEFQGETRITSFSGTAPDLVVRKVSSGAILPLVHVGTAAELRQDGGSAAEPWEGCIVQVDHVLRVVRTAATGGLPPQSFIAIDRACIAGPGGSCDSVQVDLGTLADGSLALPPSSALFEQVRGIFTQGTSGYRIQVRDAGDLVAAAAPNVSDAFPVAADTLRVTFDHDVTAFSAENVANYQLGSGAAVLSATRVSSDAIHLKIANGLPPGGLETLTVSGIVSSGSNLVMSAPQSRSFIMGVLAVADLQAPDPAALAGNPCVDRSRFAGAGQSPGARLTFRGTVVKGFGAAVFMTDPAPGVAAPPRTGVLLLGAGVPLLDGHRYLVATRVLEVAGETQATGSVYVRDEGLHAADIPLPQNQLVTSIAALEDNTCDATQTLVNGEDFEGVLVQLDCVRISAGSDPPPGGSFRVAGPAGVFTDELQVVDAGGSYTYDPDPLRYVSVAGLLRFEQGAFRLYPRSNADIIDLGFTPPCSARPSIDVSRLGADARDPEVLLAPGGTLFTAWGQSNDWVAYASSLDKGVSFTRSRLFPDRGRQPAAVATRNGTLVVATGSVDPDLPCSRSLDGGRSFLPAVMVRSAPGSADPAMAVVAPFTYDHTIGPGPREHAPTWLSLVWDVDSTAVWYAKSEDDAMTFTGPVQISPAEGPDVRHWLPTVASFAKDTIYVAWNRTQNDNPRGRVEFVRSVTLGATFEPPVVLSDPVRSAYDPHLVAPSAGKVEVMWVYAGGKDSVIVAESTDGGATFARRAAVPIPGDGGGTTHVPSFVSGRDGTLYAVVQATLGGNQECLFFELPSGSSTPTTPFNFTNSPGASLSPVVTLDGSGNPVIVWSEIYGGSRDILFRR
jgi:hypothetical protein